MHTRELGLTREGVRDGFARAIGTYDGLTKNDVYQLAHMVGVELCRRNRRIEGGRAKGTQMTVSMTTVDHDSKGRLTSACVCVHWQDAGRGTFVSRDGISLNRDCSIDIAEWADERDVQPFLRALDAWVDEVAGELFWKRMHADGGGRDD